MTTYAFPYCEAVGNCNRTIVVATKARLKHAVSFPSPLKYSPMDELIDGVPAEPICSRDVPAGEIDCILQIPNPVGQMQKSQRRLIRERGVCIDGFV